MAIAPSQFEPQTLAAGDTISFLKSLSDYLPSAGWSLLYELAGDLNYQFTSTASGESHQLTVAAAVTALWVPGEYELSGYAVNAGTGERVQIYQARLVVTPNVATGETAPRSHAAKMVELIEAVMLGKAAHDILESDIEASRIKRISPAELRTEYSFWKAQLSSEEDAARAAHGLPNRRKIKPRFQITNRQSVPIGYASAWPFSR